MRKLLLLCVLAGLLPVGCVDTLNMDYTKPAQMKGGIVYILPGIQGVDYHYKNIRSGLIGSGVRCAIKIHPWGCQIPGLNLLINQTNTLGDREWGKKIAEEIVQYQKQYPGKPVFLIGQSGGAGVSVFCAEALAKMPDARPINGLILLDGSISANYDLSKALGMCTEGIVNFFNLSDKALLQYGTAIMGNVDGGHGESAGRVGFGGRWPKLFQVKITADMVDDFADPHFADCTSAFTSQYIAPWIIDRAWPPSHSLVHEFE